MHSRKSRQGAGTARRTAVTVAPTRAEMGCINDDLHVSADYPISADDPISADAPRLMVFHENWVSKADLGAHFASPHCDAFGLIAGESPADPPTIRVWSHADA